MSPRNVIAVLVVVLVILVALRVSAARAARRRGPLISAAATRGRNPEFEALLRRGDSKPGSPVPTPPSARPSPAHAAGAAALLAEVRRLQAAGAPWPQILAAVNPRADATIGDLLANLRGPHQFAPQVALNALEDACERVLAADPGADVAAALREALRRADVVTQVRS